MALSLQLIVFLPLIAALIAGLGGRVIGKTAAKVLTTGSLMVGAVLSWPILFQFMTGSAEAQVVPVLDWIRSGDLVVDWALRVDTLTAVMLVVVTTVSSLVHLYSWGLGGGPEPPRFFDICRVSFAMLMLVTADSLVQMFFGWEGVGLASYLLIGFWYHKPSANAAALKAFVVNRVGDFGFSLGIFGTFLVFGTVSIPAILEAAPGMAGSTIGFAGLRVDTMTLLCLLVRRAMASRRNWASTPGYPTRWRVDPGQRLIHAATMVTAGVFMVCRLSPMFAAGDGAGHRHYVGAPRHSLLRRHGPERHQARIAFRPFRSWANVLPPPASPLTRAAMFPSSPTPSSMPLLFPRRRLGHHAMHLSRMRYRSTGPLA